jgi:hypothetical protein
MIEGYTKDAIVAKLNEAARVLREHPSLYEQHEWRKLCCMVRVPVYRTFVRFYREHGGNGQDFWIDFVMEKLRAQGKTMEQIAVWLEHISAEDIVLL